eukprot:1252063-Lingulodinium_polyedra.AAC.1
MHTYIHTYIRTHARTHARTFFVRTVARAGAAAGRAPPTLSQVPPERPPAYGGGRRSPRHESRRHAGAPLQPRQGRRPWAARRPPTQRTGEPPGSPRS